MALHYLGARRQLRGVNYLRHAPLTFWVAVCVALGGLLVAASAERPQTSLASAPSSAGTSQSRDAAMAAMARVSGVYPAIHSNAVTQWADDTRQQFENSLDNYINSGGDTEDPLGQAWLEAIDAAEDLSAAPESRRLMKAAVLGQKVHYLVSLSSGVGPVPALPEDQSPTQDSEKPEFNNSDAAPLTMGSIVVSEASSTTKRKGKQ